MEIINNILDNFGAIDFTEIVGFTAFLTSLASYQFLAQRQMFAMRILANALWVAHYVLLGTLNAAAVIFIGVIRTIFTVFLRPDLKIYVIITAIIGAFLVCYFYQEEGFVKYLPFFAGFFFSIAELFKDDFLKCRIIMIFGPLSFLIFGFIYGSYAVVIATSYVMISNIIGIMRYLIGKKHKI